jgi:hypothetical protein
MRNKLIFYGGKIMLKNVKEFVKDYADLMKAEGKFYSKHWVGVMVATPVIAIGGTIGTFAAIGAISKLKNKLTSKKVEEVQEEKEADDRSEFYKSTKETFRVLKGKQRS